MASISQTHDRSTGVLARVDAFFASIGMGMNAYLERASRMERIRALEAKSDAELAELGIKREEIVQHVFRDLMAL